MSEWRNVLLGEVVTLQRGFDMTAKDATPGPYPVISSGGAGYTIDLPKVAGPGVITGRKGVLGKVYFSEGPFWPHDTTLWVKDFKGSVPKFVYYLLQTLPLASLDAGASNPTLNRNHAHLLPVTVPPPSLQAPIAEVLGGLDAMVENNRRRVELLEEMARAIYREWFVHFRFPGHEDLPLVGSDLGPIPAGWGVTTCGEALTVLGGGTPSKKEPRYWEAGTVPWYTPSDLTKRRNRFAADPDLMITDEGVTRSSARLFPAGSVLMTSRATLGVLAIATTEATCNQGFIVIPPDERWPSSFIYEWLDFNAGELEALGTGATFKEITKGAFKRFPFLMPPEPVLTDFGAVVGPIDDHIRVLETQCRTLASIRDLLLPGLVAGRIDVSSLNLDALMEQGAA